MPPFTPLGDTLHNKSEKNSPQRQSENDVVLEITLAVFAELFGVELSSHAKPLFLKNRTLTISCGSAAIAQEIRLNQTQIVEKINQKLGKNEVDRIRYLA